MISTYYISLNKKILKFGHIYCLVIFVVKYIEIAKE